MSRLNFSDYLSTSQPGVPSATGDFLSSQDKKENKAMTQEKSSYSIENKENELCQNSCDVKLRISGLGKTSDPFATNTLKRKTKASYSITENKENEPRQNSCDIKLRISGPAETSEPFATNILKQKELGTPLQPSRKYGSATEREYSVQKTTIKAMSSKYSVLPLGEDSEGEDSHHDAHNEVNQPSSNRGGAANTATPFESKTTYVTPSSNKGGGAANTAIPAKKESKTIVNVTPSSNKVGGASKADPAKKEEPKTTPSSSKGGGAVKTPSIKKEESKTIPSSVKGGGAVKVASIKKEEPDTTSSSSKGGGAVKTPAKKDSNKIPSSAKGGGAVNKAPAKKESKKMEFIEFCIPCASLAYYLRRKCGVACDPIKPDLATLRRFYQEHGKAATLEKYGFKYDWCRSCPADEKSDSKTVADISPPGHQQFVGSMFMVQNDIYMAENDKEKKLLDDNFNSTRWLLLTPQPDATAKTKSGKIIPAEEVDKLFDLIRDGKSHKKCKIVQNIEQVKHIIDLQDIRRCTYKNCYGFSWCGEALLALSLMRGIKNVEMELLPEAFELQCDLECSRLKNYKSVSDAEKAFIVLMDQSIKNSVSKHLYNLLNGIFTIARQARRVAQSLDNKETPFNMVVIKDTINDWIRVESNSINHIDLDLDSCLERVLDDFSLAIKLCKYIEKIVKHKILLNTHPDKIIGVKNSIEKGILEKIFREIKPHVEKIRKFLFTGHSHEDEETSHEDNKPSHEDKKTSHEDKKTSHEDKKTSHEDKKTTHKDLVMYRQSTAVTEDAISRCSKLDENHREHLRNRKYAITAGGSSFEEISSMRKNTGSFKSISDFSDLGSDNTSDSSLVTWKEIQSTVAQYCPDDKFLPHLEEVYNSNPVAVDALVNYIVTDFSASSESKSQLDISLMQLALIGGVKSEVLGDKMVCINEFIQHSFPKAYDEIFPVIGHKIGETSKEAELASLVDTGIKANRELDRINKNKEQLLHESNYDDDDVNDDLERVRQVQEKNSSNQKIARAMILKYIDKIFGLFKPENFSYYRSDMFKACLDLFIELSDSKYAKTISGYEADIKVSDIKMLWINYDNKENPNQEFIDDLARNFDLALSEIKFEKKLFRSFSVMGDHINRVIKSYTNKHNKPTTAAGEGRRANRAFNNEQKGFTQNSLPSQYDISRLLSDNETQTFTIADKSLVANLRKEDRESSTIYGFPYKVISTKQDENGETVHKVQFSRKPEQEMYSGKALPVILVEEVLFNLDTINYTSEGVTCQTLDGNILEIMVKVVYLDKKSADKLNGRVWTDESRSKITKKQSRTIGVVTHGKLSIPVIDLKKYISDRYDGKLQPLVGIVENGYITRIITGNGDDRDYSHILNKILKQFGCQNLHDTDAISVYKASKLRKDKLSKKSGGYNRLRNMECVDTDLQSKLKKEEALLKGRLEHNLDKYADEDKSEIADVKARLSQIAYLFANPPSISNVIIRSTIFSALPNIKITLDERLQIEQILRDHWRERTHPDDRVPILMTRGEVQSLIEEKRIALIHLCDAQVACLDGLKSAIDSYYVHKLQEEKRGEVDLIVDVKDYNNFTKIEKSPIEKKRAEARRAKGSKPEHCRL